MPTPPSLEVPATLPTLRAWQLGAVFVAAFVLLFARRPDALTNPQIWAEAGTFYQQAYQWGAKSLVVPTAGYFHVVPRLVALAAQLVPMAIAPLVFNLFALTAQIAPVLLLISSRFADVPLGSRALLSLVYLVLPNCHEIHACAPNSQWHLAILGFLVLVAEPPRSRAGRVFDVTVLVMCAVGGGFAILLLPIALVMYVRNRRRGSLVSVLVLGAGAMLPFVAPFLNPVTRPKTELGATPALLSHILGGRVFLSSLIGYNGFEVLVERLYWSPTQVRLIAFFSLLGATVLLAAFVFAPFRIRLFVLFVSMVLTASLLRPSAGDDVQYPLLAVAGGGRYWFPGMLAFLVSLGWIATRASSRVLRHAAAGLLLLLPIGIVLDFRHPPYVDFRWREEAARFEALPAGSVTRIPINPPGWSMAIQKK